MTMWPLGKWLVTYSERYTYCSTLREAKMWVERWSVTRSHINAAAVKVGTTTVYRGRRSGKHMEWRKIR